MGDDGGPIIMTTRLQSSVSASSSSSKSEQSKEPSSSSSQSHSIPPPSTFREAEVAGLRLMQDGRHEEALKGECYLSFAIFCFVEVITRLKPLL